MKHASHDDAELIRELMAGGHHKQQRAEKLLKECDPHSLPRDFLDIWLHADLEEQYRPGRGVTPGQAGRGGRFR